MYGQIPAIGDLVVSAGGSGLKIGKVYSFDKNGYPMIRVAEKDRYRLLYTWRSLRCGVQFIVLSRKNGAWLTPPVNDRLELDYDAGEPSFLGRDVS